MGVDMNKIIVLVFAFGFIPLLGEGHTKGIGFLGRDGFFDLFQEVAFNQKAKMFRLKQF